MYPLKINFYGVPFEIAANEYGIVSLFRENVFVRTLSEMEQVFLETANEDGWAECDDMHRSLEQEEFDK